MCARIGVCCNLDGMQHNVGILGKGISIDSPRYIDVQSSFCYDRPIIGLNL
jgi:hypothetical protein